PTRRSSDLWIVHTGSGGVHLRLPNDAAFDLNARTSSGSISLEHPVTVQGTLGRKEIRGKVRGGGVQIEVQTGSGNIEILGFWIRHMLLKELISQGWHALMRNRLRSVLSLLGVVCGRAPVVIP